MKRIRLVTALLAVGLLGIMALGASSASATVLCKSKSAWPYCKAENVYPVGSKLYFGSTSAKLTDSYGWAWMKCKGSGITFTVTNSGGEWTYNEAEAAINEFPFVECSNDLAGAISNPVVTGSPKITFNLNSETGAGEFGITGEVLEFEGKGLGGTCRYNIVGKAGLGPAEGQTLSRMTFDKELSEPTGANNACSGITGYFSGNYNQLYTETPVYIMRGYSL